MKNDVEGSFIPIRTCELILPEGYKPEETQAFTTKLKPKRGTIEKSTENPKSLKKTASCRSINQESNEDDLFPPSESQQKPIQPVKLVQAAKTTPKIRPYTARPNPLPAAPGKTVVEIDAEENEKNQAREFVTSWLNKTEQVRQNEIKKIEDMPKNVRFDNKLSEEISVLIKKIENTRKSTASSIKNMRKTMENTGNTYKKEPTSLALNPFKSFYPPNSRKDPKSVNAKLDLKALYSNEFVFSKNTEKLVVSDDEEFVKDIEFED